MAEDEDHDPEEGRDPTEDVLATDRTDPDPGHAESSAVEETGPGLVPATGSVVADSPEDRAATIQEVLADVFGFGTVVVHYETRDVEFKMDGQSGLRLMAVLAGTSNDIDPIDRRSDSKRGWVMVDRHHVIGAQWIPDRMVVPARATMDPAGLLDRVP